MKRAHGMNRRSFFGVAGSCAAHLALTLGAGTTAARSAFAALSLGKVATTPPWGRIEELAEGAWALVSTPLANGDTRTFSNGGIIGGRDGVLVVEGFASDEGAGWMAESARELTGKSPTHVVLTHYHGDHSHGLSGYGDGPILVSTDATRAGVAKMVERGHGQGAHEALSRSEVQLIDEPITIDLGGRSVRIVPRAGHTSSDLVVVLEDPRIVWCGDLVWNGLFPNYMDATPSVLSEHVGALHEHPAEVWVPGHGSLADHDALMAYKALLDDVESAARRAIEAGTPVGVAAREYAPPESLGEWTRFSPGYYGVAFEAWRRELS